MLQITTATKTAHGTKYHQEITDDTPREFVDSDGYRMEDAVAVRVSDGTTLVAVADGHGSVEVARGRHVGGGEAARAAVGCVVGERLSATAATACSASSRPRSIRCERRRSAPSAAVARRRWAPTRRGRCSCCALGAPPSC